MGLAAEETEDDRVGDDMDLSTLNYWDRMKLKEIESLPYYTGEALLIKYARLAQTDKMIDRWRKRIGGKKR